MVEVVAGHGFNDGLKGHGAALGVDGWLVGCGWRGVADEDEVPLSERGECSEGLLRRDGGIDSSPAVLIEGLDGVVVFSESLAETEAEGYFAVGEVAEDFGRGPLAGSGGDADAGGTDGVDEGFENSGRGGEYLEDGAAIEEAGVGVEVGHWLSPG